MGILIDTNILIEWEKENKELAAYISKREDEDLFISVITASELLHGVHRAFDPGIRARRNAFVEGVLQNIPILPIDLSVSRAHARIWADLQSKGQMTGIHDSWIAATCMAHGFSLITANIREFKRVPGLKIENWHSWDVS